MRDDTSGIEVVMVVGEANVAWVHGFAHDPLSPHCNKFCGSEHGLQQVLRVRNWCKEETSASFASWLGGWRLGELGSLLTLRYP